MQADMKTHLSQSTGAGAFDGQHGISFAISPVAADGDNSSAMACIEAWKDASAMTGWETGANARPAIIKTASSRRMARLRFTDVSVSQTGGDGKPGTLKHHNGSLLARALIGQRASHPKLPVRSTNHVHQLRYLLALIGLVAAGYRVFNTM